MSEALAESVGGAWWSPCRLSPGDVRRWRLGPCTIRVALERTEWRLGWTSGEDAVDPSLEAQAVASADELAAAGTLERFGRRASQTDVTLQPMLADRPIVARPLSGFHVLPGEAVRMYVSSPLWIAVEVSPPTTRLVEFPSFRPSDTWLGPGTLEGTLCYATRTHCRLEVESVPRVPHRAVTPIEVVNETDGVFRLERISVPVPILSLFADGDARVWTEGVRLAHRPGPAGLAHYEVQAGPPREAPAARPLGPARQPAESHGLFRAFSTIF